MLSLYRRLTFLLCLLFSAALAGGCAVDDDDDYGRPSGADDDDVDPVDDDDDRPDAFIAMTFNTGTPGTASDPAFGDEQAEYVDAWYGNGLAWVAAIESTRDFIAQVQPDVVAFQEIFHPEECAEIPEEARIGFVCENWSPGDPTVAQTLLGDGYRVACHLEKPDKCLAVRKAFGAIEGCDADLCLDRLDGFRIEGCGGGSRVGRAIVERTDGSRLTVVSYHGTSGVLPDDRNCRVHQIDQIFVDFGDGQPAANGTNALILGDFNTDPGLMAELDESAQRWLDFAGNNQPFAFITEYGPDAPGSYAEGLNIDHIVGSGLDGDCWVAGLADRNPTPGHEDFFDHRPIVCEVWEVR